MTQPGPPTGPASRVGRDPLTDLYARPLERLYPPLGFGPGGMPMTVTGEAPPPGRPAVADASTTPEPARDTPSPVAAAGRRRSNARGIVAFLVILLLVVVLGYRLLGRGGDELDTATRSTGPVQITELPQVTPGVPTAPGDTPGAIPGVPTEPGIAAGKEVVYEVTSATSTSAPTIIYVDAVGLRTTVGATIPWSVTFTGTSNPLRILVLAGTGDAACTIKVDGQVIARDEIDDASPRRTVSCRG
ncbi:MmpS family transport accessory protein [Gordonia sp. CPCC 205515]|uniref:MmpS family transport accessory protein n=1 Tax=Gordonia sp. CPCC 205515 TaxID=3140791 RepID=UPI003AF334A5